MKKLFCLLLAVCLLAPLLPMGARAAAEDLTPYVKVLEDAMQTDADADLYGEAMFFDLDASAPRELILVRCPEDAAHAVVEVWTIRSGEAVRILHTPLVVLAGGNTGSVHVGEYEGKPILVAESRSPEVGDDTVTVTGGFKRFVMENGRVDIDESAFYTEVIDISPNAKTDPILYDKSDAVIQGVWHDYRDYLEWRHSCVLLATNAGFTGTDWEGRARLLLHRLLGHPGGEVVYRERPLGGGAGRHQRHRARLVQPEGHLHPRAVRHVPLAKRGAAEGQDRQHLHRCGGEQVFL